MYHSPQNSIKQAKTQAGTQTKTTYYCGKHMEPSQSGKSLATLEIKFLTFLKVQSFQENWFEVSKNSLTVTFQPHKSAIFRECLNITQGHSKGHILIIS